MAPFFCATATMGKLGRDPPHSGAEGCGGRHPSRGDWHPTFFIHGRLLAGTQPVESFVRVLEEELMRAR